MLAACNGDSVASDEARLTVSGIVSLTPPGGDARLIDRGQTVDFGDVIVVDEGTATIELASGDLYEVRAATDGRAASRIQVGSPPRLLAGDVLLSDGFPLAVSTGDVAISARGPTRVRTEPASVASFAGTTQIDGIDGVAEVDGLRQIALSPGSVATPIVYDATDAWDRRYLAEAHAFGERLEALSRGYTADLQQNTGLSAEFYRRVIPALDRETDFTDQLINPNRPAGELLVGAAVAVAGEKGTFRDRWTAIFSFRDQGAAWGLVALEQGVSSAPLVQTIELALVESPLSDDEPVPTTGVPTGTSAPPDTEPDDPAPEPSTTTTPPPEETTSTTTPPGPEGLLPTVLSPVSVILDELLEILGVGTPPS